MAGFERKFADGQKVRIAGPVKDAVVVRLIIGPRGKRRALYQVEYTLDDELAREFLAAGGEPRRNSQPRYEQEIEFLKEG